MTRRNFLKLAGLSLAALTIQVPQLSWKEEELDETLSPYDEKILFYYYITYRCWVDNPGKCVIIEGIVEE